MTAGGFFYLLLNLFLFILAIKTYMYPSYGYDFFKNFPEARPPVTTICMIGLHTGIVHCCMQWHKLGPHGLRRPLSTEDERTHMLTPSNEELYET